LPVFEVAFLIDTQFTKPHSARPRPCKYVIISDIKYKFKKMLQKCFGIKLLESSKLVSNAINKSGSLIVETADLFTHIYIYIKIKSTRA
jgi:hypothetical protein